MKETVFVVAPTYFFSGRGTSIRIRYHILALLELGYRISCITYPLGSDEYTDRFSTLSYIRVGKLFSFLAKNQAGPQWIRIFFDSEIIIRMIFKMVSKNNIVIHTFLHEGALIGLLLKKIFFWKKITVICDIHSILKNEMISYGYSSKIFSWIEQIIFQSLSLFFTASSPLAVEHIQSYQGNAVLLVDPITSASLKKYEKTDLTYRFVYTGGFSPDKGIIDFLLLINNSRLKEYQNIQFIFAGSPQENIESIIHNHLLRDRITVIDPCTLADARNFIATADVCIEPKLLHEGQASGKLLEYINLNKPVLCFGTHYQRNILGDTYPFSTNHTCIDDIIRYISDVSYREYLSQKVSDARKKLCTYENFKEKINHLYHQLL